MAARNKSIVASTPTESVSWLESAALTLLICLIIIAIIYVLLSSFNSSQNGLYPIVAALLALLVTGSIIVAQPKLLERMESQSSIQYYCVLIIATLLFSVELCKSDHNLILGLLVAAGVMTISLYLGNRIIAYLSVFLNIYILTMIITALMKNSTNNQTSIWNGF